MAWIFPLYWTLMDNEAEGVLGYCANTAGRPHTDGNFKSRENSSFSITPTVIQTYWGRKEERRNNLRIRKRTRLFSSPPDIIFSTRCSGKLKNLSRIRSEVKQE